LSSFMERHRLLALAQVVAAARQHLSGNSGERLLDVGGGTGWLAEELGAGLERIVVLEPRAKARAKGRKRRPEIEFVDGRAEAVPFPDASFERILAVGSLHHFADPVRGLAEMRRAMAPGGRLVIFEYPPDKGHGRFLVRFACHHALRTPAELGALVAAAGFAEVSVAETPPGYLVLGARLRAENLDNGAPPLKPA
jgi:ubiquinone/menaquinone biosynthesis C-methylase UbiE